MISDSPKFLITQYLHENVNNIESLKTKLYEQGVLSKYYEDDKLLLLYHKYDSPINNPLQRECRSLVIDIETFKIKAYSCENPLENDEGMKYLLQHSGDTQNISTCYEGTYLSLFNHNGKWYASTRRCLNSKDSVYSSDSNDTSTSHYGMLNDVLVKAGYVDFNDFTQKLDVNLSYYFVLIHHNNHHIVNYKLLFNDENYAKLCLTSIKDENMKELDDVKVQFIDETNIFQPKKLASIDEFVAKNKHIYETDGLEEGIIIRIFNKEMNKYNLIKLQYLNYRFLVSTNNGKNIYKGLLYLYQNDKLKEYLDKYPNMRKIDEYDTVGVINSIFKVCTSEIFELFKKLWSIGSGKRLNDYLYNKLSKEYKDILYNIRGLYFKKKALLFENSFENKVNYLKLSDIYNYLKSLDSDVFFAFLRMRYLMFNTVKENKEDLQLVDFLTISKYCDAINLKLCNLYTTKLFPTL